MYPRDDYGFGSAGAGTTLALAPVGFGRASGGPSRARPARRRVADLDLVADLGSRLGSRPWFRGLATLGTLIGAAVWCASGFAPLALPTPGLVSDGKMRAAAPRPVAVRAPRPAVMPEPARLDIASTLGSGGDLARLLERDGASQDDAAQAARLVAGVMPLGGLSAGTHLTMTLGARANGVAGRAIEALTVRVRLDLALELDRVNGALVLARRPIAVDATPLRLTGIVGASLYGTERAAGAPPSVVADYIRAIAQRLDIGEVAPFDRYDMVFEHQRAATGEMQVGRLLYAGIVHDGQPLRLLRWPLGGHEQWLDQTGAGAPRDGFSMPVTGARLSSGFGMRFHPILGFSRMHQGVDLAAPYGTPIVAASDGVVRFAGWHGGHGNFVQIAHDGGMGTGYGHMSGFVVQPGERVQQGQLIGYVGSTGLSTGPHCHFEVYRDGLPVDPATATFATTPRLGGAALVHFRTALARLAALPQKAASS